MKTEIEARLLDVDTEKLIASLKAHGAKFVGDWLQVRNCYDFHPPRANSWIRLRTNGKETTLTIKEIVNSNIDGTKECEIVVSDFDTCNEILNKLGYDIRSSHENRRIRYILDGVEIDIDMWPKIPTYAEFEASSEKKIREVCKKLGIDFEKLTTLDVEKVYAYYGYTNIFVTFPKYMCLEEERKNAKYDI